MTISFPFPEPPLAGRTIEVLPGLRWARLALPFALKHMNVYLLDDGSGWAVLDAGLDNQATRDAWRQIVNEGLDGQPLTRLVVSHFHPDHLGAGGWLCEEYGLPLIMPAREHAYATAIMATSDAESRAIHRRFYGDGGLEGELLDELLSQGVNYRKGVGPFPEEFTPVKAGDHVSIGDWTFQVHTGGGHAIEQAMLFDPQANVFLCADQVLARISPNIAVLARYPDSDPLADYLQSLGQLRLQIPADVLVLPGHDLPFVGLHHRIDQLLVHHEERCDVVYRACLEKPHTAYELISYVFERSFNHKQVSFALNETLAHANFMIGQGRLEAVRMSGTTYYRALSK